MTLGLLFQQASLPFRFLRLLVGNLLRLSRFAGFGLHTEMRSSRSDGSQLGNVRELAFPPGQQLGILQESSVAAVQVNDFIDLSIILNPGMVPGSL